MRTEAEFRDVALADDDRPAVTHPRHADGVVFRDLPGKQRRAHGGAQTGSGGQVFDRLRHAVHPATGLALIQLPVAGVGLRQQLIVRTQRHQRIDLRIEALDLRQVRLHHLAARHLPPVDGPGQRIGVHFNNWIDAQGFTSRLSSTDRFARGASCMQ
ncbi:hypothetical protein D3C86_1650890 [compost metagenome]